MIKPQHGKRLRQIGLIYGRLTAKYGEDWIEQFILERYGDDVAR